MRRTGLTFLLLFIGLVAGVYILAPALYNAEQVNAWSLQYLSQIKAASLTPDAPQPQPPRGHPRADIWQALGAMQSGDSEAAIALLAPHISRGEKFALQISARSYELSGNFTAAIEDWKKVGDLKALLRVAKAAVQDGDLDAARQAYQAVWDLDPREGATPLANFLIKYDSDPAAAEAIYRQVLQETPYHRYLPYWLLRLAATLEEQSKWAEAASIHEQAIREVDLMYPNGRRLARRYADLAWAYHMSGQAEKAVTAIEKTLELLPSDDSISAKDAWMRAGKIYEAGGKIEESLAAYRHVLELNPDNEEARDAIQRLETDSQK